MGRGVSVGSDSNAERSRKVKVPSGAGRVALTYAALAAAWITASDLLVEGPAWSLTDPHTLKGYLFVAVTTFLLYGLVRRLLASIAASIVREAAVEQELVGSEMRYRTAFIGSPDAMTISDLADGTYLDANDSFTRITGWTRDELIGRSSLDLGVWVTAADRQRVLQEIRDKGRCENFETLFRTKDGLIIDAVLTAHRLQLGQRTCLLAVSRDITNRKRTEQELRKLSMAVEQSPESIVITNLGAEIEYVNQAFLRTTGYAWDEVIGQNPKMLHSGHTPPDTFADMWQTLRKGRPWKGEFINRRKDGSEYVEFAIIAPIRQVGGKITHYLAIKDDITEKKRLGEELTAHREHLEELVVQRTAELARARREAEAASGAKSDFLANMSHEIRTPMNAILGFAELLRSSPLTPEQSTQLNYIGDAGRHLMAIINDILDLSKIEAGKLVLEHVEFSLPGLFEEVRVLVVEQAAAKGVQVVVDVGDVPHWLRGDPTRLRQALLNFASNAVKFTPRGRIDLRARLLESADAQVLVRIEVCDTGVGIPAAALPLLFQPFQQLDASTTRKHGGTGLGLAITQRLAELMGGEAGAQSTQGEGSTFWFTARLGLGRSQVAAAFEPDDDATHRLRGGHAGARILLVEDEPLNQEVARAFLADTGLVVDVAENGRQAVAMAGGGYDLILMDVQMPEMDGLEATRAIRASAGGASIPIIAVTANVFEEDRRRCRDAGMNDFISKPVERAQLLGLLLKWLR